jgi:23S rRNA (cytosine1962-C5)-methyltransferase
MLSWGDDPFSRKVLSERIRHAVACRYQLLDTTTDSCRLINSEGDFLPGLIVDRFSDGLVLQILTAGMERMRNDIAEELVRWCTPHFIFERSDSDARKREGLRPSDGTVYGTPPPTVTILENGLRYSVDIAKGQKTGFFFDQRENRKLLRLYTDGKRVADCFSYNGGFSLNALAGGAQHVTAVDQSVAALELLERNVINNGFEAGLVVTVNADVFSWLRETEGHYDCVILDPPKFARHPGETARASRGYKDINLMACRKITPGGIIFTFSCSHAVDGRLFRQIVFGAAADSGRRFQLLHTLSAGPDHPVNLAHREGEYLKGLALRAEE